MKVFENMLGMFVHWWFYAQLGLQEQAFARYDMERGVYEKYAETFNPTEYDPEKKVKRIGNWYNRMKGCLESAEADDYDYGVMCNEYIATRTNGRTYFRFYNNLISDAVSLSRYPALPVKVTLMNTGVELSYDVTPLPSFFNGETGIAEKKYLHIHGIPVEELSAEPIVLEVRWQN